MVKVTWLPLPCVLKKSLVFISPVSRIILCSKGLGRLLLLSYPFYFACLLPFCCLNQKPLNIYLLVFAAFPYPRSLVNTFCSSLGSTLLLIENTTIDPWYVPNVSIISAWSMLLLVILIYVLMHFHTIYNIFLTNLQIQCLVSVFFHAL